MKSDICVLTAYMIRDISLHTFTVSSFYIGLCMYDILSARRLALSHLESIKCYCIVQPESENDKGKISGVCEPCKLSLYIVLSLVF